MSKLKFYLLNGLASSLIGLAVWVVYVLMWGCLHSFHRLIIELSNNFLANLASALFSMGVGAVIGTISLLFCFQVFLRLSHLPWLGFLTNFLAVAVLNIVGAILTGAGSYRIFINSMWLTALIVSEILSFFLGLRWFKMILAYKQKLEDKKAALKL